MENTPSWVDELYGVYYNFWLKDKCFRKVAWVNYGHQHCIFDGTRISNYDIDENERQGYQSTDGRVWFCPTCFELTAKRHNLPLIKNTVQMIEDALINNKKVIISLRNDQYFIERKAGKICVCRKDEIVEYNSIEEMEAKQPFYGKCIGEIIDEIYIGIC